MTVYTIGHSNISLNAFIEKLKQVGIEELVDVRSVPYSKYASQFNKERLSEAIIANDIKYVYMGNLLGGIPKNFNASNATNYNSIRKKVLFQEGINKLLELISRYRLSIMCAEEDPMRCHRRNIIGAEIHKFGVTLLHIRKNGIIETDDFLDKGKIMSQPLLF